MPSASNDDSVLGKSVEKNSDETENSFNESSVKTKSNSKLSESTANGSSNGKIHDRKSKSHIYEDHFHITFVLTAHIFHY